MQDQLPHADNAVGADEAEFVTLTVLVQPDGTRGDPCDVMLELHPDVLFVGHQDEDQEREDVVTLTIVVRRDGAQGNPCDVLLGEHPDVLSMEHRDGVTLAALALGADPSSWD